MSEKNILNKVLDFFRRNKIALALIFILSFSAFLRFYNLGSRPTWHTDEGSHLEIAWNLMHGSTAVFAFDYTFIPHLPLFFFLGGIFTLILGKTILAMRIFTVVCSLAATYVIFLIGKTVRGPKTGLLAALIFTIHIEALIFSRYAFPSDLIALEIALVAYFMVKYLQSRDEGWLFRLAIILGLVSITEVYIYPVFLVLPYLLWREPKKLGKFLAISLLPFAAFIGVMSLIKGGAFWQDINNNFIYRFTNAKKLHTSSGSYLFTIFKIWLFGSGWNAPGIVGLLLLTNKKVRAALLFLFAIVLVSVFFPNLLSFMIRNQIIFYPFVALGAAVLIMKVYGYVTSAFLDLNSRFLDFALKIIVIAFFLLTFRSYLAYDAQFFAKNPDPKKYSYLEDHLASIHATADFINSRTATRDLAISPDYFGHLLTHAKSTNILQSAAYDGVASNDYSTHLIGHDRFLFNASLDRAKYVIMIGQEFNFFREDVPTLIPVLDKIQSWPVAFTTNPFIVFQNPVTTPH